MSGHSMPISLILMGSHFGHLKLSPVADPTPMKTPNPGFVKKLPSPLKPKFRASPDSSSDPTFTSAPTAAKLTRVSLSAAPVSRKKSRPVSVTKLPSVTLKVSTLKTKALILPSSNSSVARSASVSGLPGRSLGSAVVRSEISAEMGLPGKNLAPPEAMKMLPSKSSDWPKITSKFCTPTRMSVNSRMPPMEIAAPGVVCCACCGAG